MALLGLPLAVITSRIATNVPPVVGSTGQPTPPSNVPPPPRNKGLIRPLLRETNG